jgi:hypothetical protein
MPDAPDWRDSGSGPSEPGGSRPWQPKDAAPDSSAKPGKRTVKRIAAVVALLAIAVGIGIVFLWLRPIKPACLVLIGSGYEQNLLLPHNAYGWNGLTALEKDVTQEGEHLFRLPWDQPTQMRRVGSPIEPTEQTWKEIWDKIDIASYKEKNVVVFISLHGSADKDEAYLLPNAPPKVAPRAFNQSRIPFRDVLDSLKSVKKKNIVLLLDVCHANADWPIGMLHNDFVKRLQEKYQSEIDGMSNLSVICSTSPDQRSWPSDELQKTIFAHYVAQGLQGAGQNVHERVTAWKLFKFVEEKVDKWVQTNRARRQTPILLGSATLAKEIEIVHIAEAFAEPETASAKFDPEGLKREWSKWQSLKSEQGPQVYAPHLWRLYQDTLLRFERLTRAGDPTGKAADVQKSLEKLHADILASRHVDRTFASLGYSLPMHMALGFRPASADLRDPALHDFLASLRKADTEDERSKVLARYKDKSALEKQFIQVRLSQFILKELEGQPRTGRKRELERLADLERDLRAPQRPAEAHLLKMLADADPALDDDTVKLALRVRMLAEETALGVHGSAEPYAEVVYAWSQKEIEKADKLRREGEDFLFGDPNVHAVKARIKLTEAQDQYDKVGETSRQLQRALALRDELSAELPYVAAWVAAAPFKQEWINKNGRLLRDVENLGQGLAGLNRALDVDRKLVPAADLAQLAGDLNTMRVEYRSECATLSKAAVLQSSWRALDTALSVPPLDSTDDDVAMRVALLTKLRTISGELHRSTDLEGKAEEEDTPKNRIERQRKLLRACLSSFDEIQGQDKDSVDDKVRDFFMRLPQDIVSRSEGTIGAEAEAGLVIAANWCRAIPGAQADLVRNEKGERLNPVDRLRRLRTYRWLHALAERTWEDHWFEPGAALDPYYVPAAKAYLDSARGLFDREQLSKAFIKEDDALLKKLVAAGLTIAKEPSPYWTTETDFPLAWQLQAEDGVPRGTPMVWMTVKRGSKSLDPEPRKAVTGWPTAQNPHADPFHLHKKSPSEDDVTVVFHSLYRGQHRTSELQLLRAQPKVLIRNVPAPEKAGLAVRMDATFDYGAVSIVLDNSGSMKYVHPEKDPKDKERKADRAKGEKRRFDYALDALRHVLKRVPDNTSLSIFTLGRKEGNEYVTAPTEYQAPSRWRQEKLPALLADLGEIPGDIASPIADGIVASMKDGFPPNFKGPKVVLVLTDGDDNYSFDSAYNPKKPEQIEAHTAKVVAGLEKANRANPDVTVFVVCFIQKENPEFNIAEAQFKGVKQFDPPGRFEVVPEGERLGIAIEGLLRPRVELRLDGRAADGFTEGQPINYPGDQALKWMSVRPNHFRARLARGPSKETGLDLQAGENVFALLKRKEKDPYLERGVLGLQREITTNKNIPDPIDKDGWLVSLLENHNSLGNRLSQLLVFEKSQVEDTIRQTQPGFVWIELATLDGKRPDQTLTWGRDWSVPAAGFRLGMPEWPVSRASKVSAWLWPEERDKLLAEEKLVVRATVPIDSSRPIAPGRIGANPIIESVRWEMRDVETASGEIVKEKCLALRVRHTKGRPVFVALQKDRPDVGSEHHYFPDAARSTTYFYKLPRVEELELVLIDVEAFKQVALRVDFTPEQRYRAPAMFLNRGE